MAGRWAWAGSLLAMTVIFWICGYWFVFDGWWHRRLLWWSVFPAAVLALPFLRHHLPRGARVWLVLALLAFQVLSRTWSSGAPPTRVASLGDTCGVLLLLLCVSSLGRGCPLMKRAYPIALAVVATVVMGWSLLEFYAAHSLAEDRFRNVFVYATGLNPVLTGLLCATAALHAVPFLGRAEGLGQRWTWGLILCLQVFCLCATQSRTAIVALVAGMATYALLEKKRVLLPATAVLAAAACYYLLVLVLPGAGAESVSDLLARGTTGRASIYRNFLGEMAGFEHVVGRGMGTPAELPAATLGWHVHHPHNAFLTQYYLTGAIGLTLLVAVLALAFRAAWQLARTGQPVWLCLLAGNVLALMADGAQVFSLHSIPRLEFLLLVVPAAMAVALAPPPGERPRLKGTDPPSP